MNIWRCLQFANSTLEERSASLVGSIADELLAAKRNAAAMREEHAIAERQLAEADAELAVLTERISKLKVRSSCCSSGTRAYTRQGLMI